MSTSTIAWLLVASKLILGGGFFSRPELKLRTLYWLRGMWHFRKISKYLASPALPIQRELQQEPQLLGVLIWPLVDNRWSSGQRLLALERHFEVVESFGDLLTLRVGECRFLLPLERVDPDVTLQLERQAFLGREGQLALSLFCGSERLYSVAFLLHRCESTLTVYVGAIQGVKQDPGNHLYRNLTKSAFGLRPRDRVLSLFLVFFSEIGVTCVHGVQEQFRQHRHHYHGRAGCTKLFSDLDATWVEHGGVLSDAGYYVLEPGVRAKALESVPTRKRAMYRKRYEFLQDVREKCRSLAGARNAVIQMCLMLALQFGDALLGWGA